MAIINKTGITTGGTIQAEHITRAIDALSGGSTDTIVATGSFTGSFKGDGSQLSGISAGFPFTGSARITGSLSITGSVKISNADASSPFINVQSGITNSIDISGAVITLPGATISGSSQTYIDLSKANSYKAGLSIPVSSTATNATTGSMYFDTGSRRLYIYDGTQWTYSTFTILG